MWKNDIYNEEVPSEVKVFSIGGLMFTFMGR